MDDKVLKEEQLTLELLDAIEKDSDISQRHLARKMGIALGLANSYLKRCIKKGLIKIHDAPANRYLYYLTPHGFAEKSRLTASYLSYSFSFYREAGDSCLRAFQNSKDHGWNSVILCGISDLAEIASLKAIESNIDISYVFDAKNNEQKFINKRVIRKITEVEHDGAYLVTDLHNPKHQFDCLSEWVPNEKILVPDVLKISH